MVDAIEHPPNHTNCHMVQWTILAVESTNFHLACAMAHRHTLLAVHVSPKGLPLPSYAIYNSKLAKCSLIVGLAFQWDVSGGHVGILIGLGSGIYGLLGTDHSLL